MEPAQFSVIETVRKSLRLAWEHKILWVFALLLAGGSAGVGNNFNSFGSGDSTTPTDLQEENFFDFDEMPSGASEAISVLGLNSLAQASVFDENIPFVDPSSMEATAEQFESATPEEIIRELEAQTGETLPPGFIELIYESTMSEGGLEGFPPAALFGGEEFPPYGDEFPPIGPASGSQFPFDPALLSQLTDIGQRALPNLILVIFVFVFAMLFYMAVWLVVSQWANGALLTGIDDAIKGDPYTLRKLGTQGRISARELVKLKILIFLIVFAFLLFTAVFGVVIAMGKSTTFLPVLILIILLIGLILFLFVSYGSLFAIRLITLKQYRYIEAFKEGLRIFKKNFVKSMYMSCANCLVVVVMVIALVTVLAVGGLVAFGVGGVLLSSESIRTVVLVILGILSIPIAFSFVMGMLAVRAYVTTYTQFTWSFLFNFATGSDDATSKKQEQLETQSEGLEPKGGKDGE